MKKICNKYYFSVEGETEKWYLEHLQNLINEKDSLPYKVKFDIKINKSIISRAKSISAPYKVKVFHICDYESKDEKHVNQFDKVLKDLSLVKKINRNLDYELGYSNFSFDLWIILHKIQKAGPISHRKQYINEINSAYTEKFKYIDDYKEEKNFKRILSKISLNDVINAVKNGNELRKKHENNPCDKYKEYGGFKYYIENPDMTINKCIEHILIECGAM